MKKTLSTSYNINIPEEYSNDKYQIKITYANIGCKNRRLGWKITFTGRSRGKDAEKRKSVLCTYIYITGHCLTIKVESEENIMLSIILYGLMYQFHKELSKNSDILR